MPPSGVLTGRVLLKDEDVTRLPAFQRLRRGPFICSENRPKITSMSKSPEKPFFHIILSDHDEMGGRGRYAGPTSTRQIRH